MLLLHSFFIRVTFGGRKQGNPKFQCLDYPIKCYGFSLLIIVQLKHIKIILDVQLIKCALKAWTVLWLTLFLLWLDNIFYTKRARFGKLQQKIIDTTTCMKSNNNNNINTGVYLLMNQFTLLYHMIHGSPYGPLVIHWMKWFFICNTGFINFFSICLFTFVFFVIVVVEFLLYLPNGFFHCKKTWLY